MIKINLLSIERKKHPMAIPPWITLTVLFVLISIIAYIVINNYLNNRIYALKARDAENRRIIANLDKTLKEIESYEKMREEVEKRVKLIVGLSKAQDIPVITLDKISELLPENTWLTSLNLEVKNKKLVVSGTSFTNRKVVEYINRLKENGLFINVYLVYSRSNKVEEIPVYDFQISMGIEV